MTRPLLDLLGDYDARSVEKVERLLELLGALRANAYLESRLVLHGGTALNLFQLPRVPRLSVDIDLLYVGSAALDVMLAEREEVIRQFSDEARLLGYAVGPPSAPRDQHAGVTVKLGYGGRAGDHIKVDLNFLDRVPVRGWFDQQAVVAHPSVQFSCVQPHELIARKVAAVVSRTAVRDLYDLQSFPSLAGDAEFRALVTFYYSLADCFPQRELGGAALDGFLGHDAEVERELHPMLAEGDRPTLAELIDRVRPFLVSLGEFDAAAREYLRLLDEEGAYRPELLFSSWPETLANALRSPRMEWKLQNLRKRPR